MAPATVQSLAGLDMGKLSLKDFEWQPHLRPSSSLPASSLSIPEIDLQALHTQYPPDAGATSSDEYAALVASLSHAASNLGFFQVYNHGISLSALDDLQAYACKFFALPFSQKYAAAELLHHPSAGPSGYCSGSPCDRPNKWWSEAIRVSSSDKPVIDSVARCLCFEEREQQAFWCSFSILLCCLLSALMIYIFWAVGYFTLLNTYLLLNAVLELKEFKAR